MQGREPLGKGARGHQESGERFGDAAAQAERSKCIKNLPCAHGVDRVLAVELESERDQDNIKTIITAKQRTA